jgi:1-deoxy-D-xylulose-5-phosphate synthase
MYEYLDKIKDPKDIKDFTLEQLGVLSGEIRDKIISTTSKKGGHLAASLGTVELTVAMHYCMESPIDKIVWDVGHQSYAHKLLTGRFDHFDTLREMGGISGFPNKNESVHDHFTCGHSATSISSALGLAVARDLKGEDHNVAAVIGDASLATGLSFEGLNSAGNSGTNINVILNDNEHSISAPVGAMSTYLNHMLTNPLYNRVRNEAEKAVKGIPKLGMKAYKTLRKIEEGVKHLLVPGILFEELGFRYFGPIDGHDLNQLVTIFRNTFSLKEPVLIHLITKKGKGYKYAEDDPTKFHGVKSFGIETGEMPSSSGEEKTFTDCFGEKIVELAEKDPKITVITAAMKDGTGLNEFAKRFPDRIFDVGICEEHAVTFSAGLAKGGFKPVVVIYSTFLQRAYDQIIHDVALQDLPVTFCLDRGGLVGKDGPTHHGVFDIAYMRGVPGLVFMAPKDGEELDHMLELSVNCDSPCAIRYPREYAHRRVGMCSCAPMKIGTAEKLRDGKDLAIIAVGSMVNITLEAADILSEKGIELTVINARFIKPLDINMLCELARNFKTIVTVEEGIVAGGFGSAVMELFQRENITDVNVKCLGLPDEFIEHGARKELLRKYHLAPDELAATIKLEIIDK